MKKRECNGNMESSNASNIQNTQSMHTIHTKNNNTNKKKKTMCCRNKSRKHKHIMQIGVLKLRYYIVKNIFNKSGF